jgi:hypothetical protein
LSGVTAVAIAVFVGHLAVVVLHDQVWLNKINPPPPIVDPLPLDFATAASSFRSRRDLLLHESTPFVVVHLPLLPAALVFIWASTALQLRHWCRFDSFTIPSDPGSSSSFNLWRRLL